MRETEDIEAVKRMCKSVNIHDIFILKAIRLGSSNKKGTAETKPRLLLVSLDEIKKKRQLLARSKSLRQHDEWNQVYISPDLTPKEREDGKKLRDKLKEMHAGNSDSNYQYIIKRGKIIKVKVEEMEKNEVSTAHSGLHQVRNHQRIQLQHQLQHQ